MAFRRKPRNNAKPEAKDAPKDPSPDAPRMIKGIRIADASTIMRGGR